MDARDKVLIHVDTDAINAYILKDDTLHTLAQSQVLFDENPTVEILAERIGTFLEDLKTYIGVIDNMRVRLYATGIFQKLSRTDQDCLIINVYVNCGLYFNIISPALEQFYKEKSVLIHGSPNVMLGLICQEFRSVVICGSFQKNLEDIGRIMTILQKRNISVLSPWTTKIVPETLGTDFILLEGQEPLKNHRDAWRHKYIHMNKFRNSDAIIVCNPGGRIGKGTMFEFGFMVALSKRIIFTESPVDLSIPFPYEIGLNFE